ncbi:hypothetical protein HZH66_013776 [Vespula vulgaris]|uniref:Uncharacterized protein n=1 Tax=Vespula vulgaris TaxID=7454 RepID=A0A834J4P4_VESVU|nr:hypothetical protein HZH66_013776 [Vespula vulgaris]
MLHYLAVRTLRKIKWCSGNTLILVKRYKETDIDSRCSLATNFHHSHLNTSSTHSPHLCFGHRREDLEIFADAIRTSINEQLIQVYNISSSVVFCTSTREHRSFRRKPTVGVLTKSSRKYNTCEVGILEMRSGDTIPPGTTTKSVL